MFRYTLLIVMLTLVVLFGFYYWIADKTGDTLPDKASGPQTTITIKGVEVPVEVSDDIPEQILGLSGRESLPAGTGMLFVFSSPIKPGFWMKEMKFPIDIIWINESGIIIGIEKNLAPETYPQNYFPPDFVKYVLEVNAGWSDQNNIKPGDEMELGLDML